MQDAKSAYQEQLSRASIVFGYDTGDVSRGYRFLDAAANIAIEAGWSDEETMAIHEENQPLVSWGFMRDIILNIRQSGGNS